MPRCSVPAAACSPSKCLGALAEGYGSAESGNQALLQAGWLSPRATWAVCVARKRRCKTAASPKCEGP